MKHDISNREDVLLLVSSFYDRVRGDGQIGHFFNDTIKDWPSHIEKLTDFWETNLFLVSKFRGNPIKAHKEVDDSFGNSIEQRHFGIWLNLWFDTIDNHFEGERAQIAKNRARNMAHNLFMNIYMSRS